MNTTFYNSPLGWLEIIANSSGVTNIHFLEDAPQSLPDSSPFLKLVVQQLDNYFHHKDKLFSFPMNPDGSDFQIRVWELLQQIPYGTTLPYLKVAQKFGDTKKVRAIAGAIAKNPILIAIPCHRIIGSDRSLVGYSGGLDRKRQLLELEGFPKQKTLF
ncbi:MAG: methylated-DNA--[protein]-cysteine S-methyltransferase [Flavobacteriaceae bacterium]